MRSNAWRGKLRWLAVAICGLVIVAFALTAVANAFLPSAAPQAPPHRASKPSLPNDWGPLPLIAGSSAESHIDPRFSRVASALAGRRVQVRCWSSEDWAKRVSEWSRWPNVTELGHWSGYTSRDRERINLSPAVCAELTHLTYQNLDVRSDTHSEAVAWSAALLAHEAQHGRGLWNEATAECYGMQSIRSVVTALGRTSQEGQYLASLYWRNSYLELADSSYRSGECRNGGHLDLRPKIDIWP